MQQSFNKLSKTSSLPKLSRQSKLFQTREDLMLTKKMFLDRLNSKDDQKSSPNDDNDRNFGTRSFIQLPRNNLQQGFTTFKSINKSESDLIFQQLKNLRSTSSFVPSFIKAEILFNKQAYHKITVANEVKMNEERKFIEKRLKEITPARMKKQVKVKQKYKSKNKNIKKINLKMDFKQYEKNTTSWKPYVDFDSIAIQIKDSVYFIGGRKQAPYVAYNLTQCIWKELPSIQGVKCFGETDPSVIENKKILCFGGYYYFQQGFSLINNTLKIIDIIEKKFQVVEFNQIKAPCRAFHSQCVYGKFLIISGGIDKNSKLFNNFMNFNYDKRYWNQLTIQKMPEKLTSGFAKHQTLAVFHTRSTYSIYENQAITEKDEDIKQQGIYLFGGEDSNGNLMGDMFIMRLGSPAIVIQELSIAGPPPNPRRNSRMIRHKEYIIIHGGRNDQMKPSVLNSMHFLHLKTLTWIRLGGQKPPYRYSHSLGIYHDDIVIMGGKGLEGLCKQIYIMPYQEIVQYV